MGIPFLNNIIINSAGHVQFKTTAGADAGKIDQVNNDLVITNAVGDVLLGDGSSDVYIGDGVNNVDILFDQSGSIKADSSTSGVTLTLGSSNTGLVLTSGADIDVTANLDVAGTVDLSNLTIDTAQGTDGQVLTSTGSGIAWEDIASETAERIEVTVKNISGGSLSKGTVVHASPSATPPSGNVIEVIAADYDDSTKMPAIGILNETIANEGEGAAVMMGAVSGIDTSSFNIGDELYVGNLGTLTNTKPVTAGQLIQKIAVVIKSHASNGLIKIFGAGRSNDVPLPLYIDNANQRVGIGEASPAHKLDVNGGAQFNTNTGTTPFYITRLGGTSQALSIKVLDDNVRFESIQDESTDNFGGFDFRMDGGVTEPDFVVRKNSGDPILNVKGDGNVGIGTTSPDTKLHISSTNAAITNPLSVSNKLRFTDDDPTQNNGQITGTIEWETKDSDSAGVQSYITTVSTNTGLGNLAFGTGAGGSASEQMRIDSSGNIGIGTTSPGYKLDVSGTIRSLGSDNAPGTGAGVELRYTGDGAGSVLAYDRGATSYLPIRIEGSTIDLRESGSSVVFVNAGKVGIGTTNPERQLSLYSNNSETTPRFLIEQDGTGDAVMAFSLTGTQGWSMGIDNSLSDSFMIHNSSGGVDSSSQFTINTSGNVGIGTVSPTSTTLLHISTPQSGAAAGTGLTISGWNGSAESRVQLMSYGIGGGTFALRTGTSNTERLRIDSNGKVGINNSSPSKTLTVSQLGDSDGITINGYDDHSASQANLYVNSSGHTYLSQTTVNASGYLILAAENYLKLQAGTLVYTDDLVRIYDGGQIQFGTGGDYKLYYNTSSDVLNIHTDDNKGITISNAGAITLNQYGSGSITGTATKNLAVDTNGNIIETDGSIIDGSGTANYVSKWSDANTLTDSQIFDNGTNVGIGIATPSQKLDINGNLLTRGDIVSRDTYPSVYVDHSGTVMGGIRADATNKLELKTLTTAPLSFQVNSSEKMRIDSDGDVGIGTTVPGRQLELRGQGVIRLNAISDGHPGIDFQTSDTNDMQIRYRAGTDKLGFYSYGTSTDVMTIQKSNGYVGIGLTSPSRPLTVESDATSIIAQFKYTAAGYSSIDLASTGGSARISSINNDLALSPGGTERVRINSSGNVGIGTSAPGKTLDVNGDIRLLGTNQFLEAASPTTRLRNMTALPGGYIEPDTFNFRFDESATAYAGESHAIGGTISQTTGTAISDGNLKRLFTYTAGYINLLTHKDSNNNVVIELDGISVSNSANNQWKPYVFFHASASNVATMTIEVKNGAGNWETVENAIDCVDFYIRDGFYQTSQGVLKGARFTFTNITGNSYLRMIGVIGKTHASYQWNVLKSGSKMFGDLDFGDTKRATFGDGEDLRILHESNNSYIHHTGAGDLYMKADTGNIQIINYTNDSDIVLASDDGSGGTTPYLTLDGSTTHAYFSNTGNVGVGTTSPAYRLDVNGDGRINGVTFVASGATRRISTHSNAGQLQLNGGTDSSGGAYININGSSYSSGRMILYSPESIYLNSDVGIGTSSPRGKLDVSGDFYVTTPNGADYLKVSDVSVKIGDYDDANGYAFLHLDSQDFKFTTDSVEVMRITSSGNVGIGATSPDRSLVINHASDTRAKLQVNGTDTAQIQTLTNEARYHALGSSTSLQLWTNGAERMRITTAGGVGIGYTSVTNKLDVNGTIQGHGYRIGSQGSGEGILRHNGTGNGNGVGITTGSFNTSSIGLYVDHISNGSLVGIGTTAPAEKLEVAGNIKATGTSFISASFDSNHYMRVESNSSGGVLKGTDGGVITTLVRSYGDSYFNGGNFGIGTTSPYTNFEVVGKGSFGVSGSSNLGVEITSVSAVPSAQVKGYIASATSAAGGGNGDLLIASRTSAATNIRFFAGSTSERMRIDSSGNVGIGMTSPPSPLSIKSNNTSSTHSGIVLQANANTNPLIQLAEKGGDKARLHMYSGGVEKIAFYTDGTANHISAGNVGIGTSSPNTTLEVGDCDSSANIDDGNLAVKTNTNDTAIVIQEASGAEQWGLGVNVNGDLIFTDSGTESIRFQDGGNIGVGVTNPSQILHIKADDATLLLQDTTTGFSSQASGIILTSTDGSGNPRTDVQYKLKVNSNTFEITYGSSNSQRFKIESDGGLFVPSLAGSSSVSNPQIRYDTSTKELYYQSSSLRYKEEVENLDSQIDKLMNLRPVKFKIKGTDENAIGLIAEEVVEVIPELTFKNDVEGFEDQQIDGVSYGDLPTYLLKAIQEQQQIINDLKTRIETLENN